MPKKSVNFPPDVPTLPERSKDDQSPPAKLQLDEFTYITRLNGNLVTVRKNRPPTIYSTRRILFQNYFEKRSQRKMDRKGKQATVLNTENKPAQSETFVPAALQIPPFDPNANLRAPGIPQSMIALAGPNGPVPGLYRNGDRQLALLPLASPLPFQEIPPGASPCSPQVTPRQSMFPYPPSIMYPPVPAMAGYNFPPMGYDLRQFLPAVQPSNMPVTQTSVAVPKHVCAKCGKTRSNKYHYYNPLKPGEVPAAAFCGKCERDLTSTDVSDNDERINMEQKKRFKKRDYKKKENGESVVRPKDLSESKGLIKFTSTKPETRSTQIRDDMPISREESHKNNTKSVNSSNPQIDRLRERRRRYGEMSTCKSQSTSSTSLTSSPPTHSASKHLYLGNPSSRHSPTEWSSSKDGPLINSHSKDETSSGSSSKHSVQNRSAYQDDMQSYARFRARKQVFNSRRSERSDVKSIITNEHEDFYGKNGMLSQPAIVKKERKVARKASKTNVRNSERPHTESRNDYLTTRSNASSTTLSSSEASKHREADLIAKDLGLRNGSYFRVIRHHGSPPAQRRRQFREEAERANEVEYIANIATRVGRPSQRVVPEPAASGVVSDKNSPWDTTLIITSDEEIGAHRERRGEAAAFGPDRNPHRLATGSAASAYYREKWSRTAQSNPSSICNHSGDVKKNWPSGPSHRYQQRTGSESSINLNDAIPLPAPMPPTASELSVEDYPSWAKFSDRYEGPYPSDPNKDSQQASMVAVASSNNKNHKVEPAQKTRLASHYRPPYVRDVTERGSKNISSKPLVRRATNELREPDLESSPDHSSHWRSLNGTHGHARERASFSEDDSDITEEIERVERRITFQDITDHGRRSSSAQRRRPSWVSRVDTML